MTRAKSPRTIEQWLAAARGTRFPPLARVAAAAAEIRDNAATARWADLYKRDPFVSLEVFRDVNERPNTHVVRLEQAPIFIGEERFFGLARSDATVERQLTGGDYEAFVRTVRRAVMRARLAEAWSRQQGFGVPEEFYFSALFSDIGELLVRLLDPGLGRRIDRHLGPGQPWTGAERDVLGFPQRQLALAVSREFDLPQLLLDEVADDGRDVGKPALVRRVIEVTDCLADPRTRVDLGDYLADLGERWDRSAAHLTADIFLCARDCARAAVKWYPSAADGRCLELYPGPYVWPAPASPREAAPKPPPAGAAADGPPPASTARPDAATTPHEAIHFVLEQLVKGTHLKRCLFLLLNRDRSAMTVRYHQGLGEDSPLADLTISLMDGNLLARVADKPGMLWVKAEQRARYGPSLKGPLLKLSPAGGFFAASIFVRGRPVGLLFADAGVAGSALRAQDYAAFKRARQYLDRRLAALAEKATATSN